jgi:hypothetical protein
VNAVGHFLCGAQRTQQGKKAAPRILKARRGCYQGVVEVHEDQGDISMIHKQKLGTAE